MPYRAEEIKKALEAHKGDSPYHRLFRETGERLLFTLSWPMSFQAELPREG
ncbi:MAG TPA: hypothetical protein PK907_10610 [Candidatus Sabulitectum sp.]|nr:hypothetical protein [Candidatus Sabulitectum sp.]